MQQPHIAPNGSALHTANLAALSAQAPVNNTSTLHYSSSFAHQQTAAMDEIAPEYDVVVLGTGGTTPLDCRRGQS